MVTREQVRMARAALGWNIKELSSRVGVAANTISRFENGSDALGETLRKIRSATALYMYPYEGHGPRAQETILDLWARWVEWLDIHVKNPERAKEMYKKAKQPKVIEDNGR